MLYQKARAVAGDFVSEIWYNAGMKHALYCLALLAGLTASAEVFEMKARPSMTPVELNKGDVCRFTLVNGETRTVEYLGTESSILEIPATEGLIATLTMHLRVDGVEIPFRRYFATQESFYEPAVVDGLRIFPDSTLEYLQKTVPMRYPATGAMRHHPWKDCRIVVQDATLPLCPEKLHPWFMDKRIDDLLIPIADTYHGGDCWLGPFAYGEAHGGMDVCMTRGDLLYAPFAMDRQWMPLYAKKGNGNNSRWRGVRRFADGTLWTVNTSHVIDALVAEGTSVTNGQPYCTAAGTATGEYDHTHFELHLCRDLNPTCPDSVWDEGWGKSPDVKNDCPKGQPEFYNVDPWMLFWQTFVQLRDERGLPAAEIAPFGPAKAGEKVAFRSARPLPKGSFAVWTFGDGAMHVGERVEHVFAKPGVHVVTLTVTDGEKVRVRDVGHIAIRPGEAKGPLLGVRADDVSFVELRPGDLPAWGEKVKFDPYSVKTADELEFFDRVGGGALKPTLVKSEKLTAKIERRVYACGNGETVEALVRGGCNAGKVHDEAFKLHVESAGACAFLTPCFWAQHHFHHKRRWYVTSGARAEKGQFVRFMPRLRGGTWRVEETLDATHAPGASYWVKVKSRDGIRRVRLEPLRDLTIGTFEFDEGEGYVQIEAEGATGPVYAGALRFTPVKLEPPKYIDEKRLAELKELRTKIEKEIRDLAAAVPYPPEMPFRPGDWQPAADIVQKLTLGKATPVQFFTALTEQYDKVQVLRGTKKEWELFIGWIYCRCWALGLKDKWVNDILKRKFEPFEGGPTETGRRVAELARKLADTIAEIEGTK